MLKINKIVIASLVSAFGFSLFSSFNSANNTSTALASKTTTNNSGDSKSKFKTLHTKIIPSDLRTTLKKSDGSYYDANRLYVRFDDTQSGYHGSFTEIKKIKVQKSKDESFYMITVDNGTTFGVTNTKNMISLIYPVGNKSKIIDFDK